MEFRYSLIAIFAIFTTATGAATKNPLKNWLFCKKTDPKLSECLVKAINQTREDIINGNAFFGTPPVDPLHFKKLEIKSFGGSKSVNIDLLLTDFDVTGLGSWNLKKAESDWDKGVIWGEILMNKPVVTVGNYKIDGKILLLPIKGEGKFNYTYEDLYVKMLSKGTMVDRKGKKYYHVDSIEVDMNPKRMHINHENLFNGNKVLGDNMNGVLNENWQEINRETQPAVSKALGMAFKELANRVFLKIPLDVLIPK